MLKGTGRARCGADDGYAVATGAYAVVVGDFNEDGRADLASASSSANKVSVLRANGSGGFLAGGAHERRLGPARARRAATSTRTARWTSRRPTSTRNTVGLLLGNGAGGSRRRSPLAAGTGPSGIAAADLNGDGRLDLAIANANSNNVTVLLATGPGTFGARRRHSPPGVKPSGVAAGDIDGDGLRRPAGRQRDLQRRVACCSAPAPAGSSRAAPVAVGVRPLAGRSSTS